MDTGPGNRGVKIVEEEFGFGNKTLMLEEQNHISGMRIYFFLALFWIVIFFIFLTVVHLPKYHLSGFLFGFFCTLVVAALYKKYLDSVRELRELRCLLVAWPAISNPRYVAPEKFSSVLIASSVEYRLIYDQLSDGALSKKIEHRGFVVVLRKMATQDVPNYFNSIQDFEARRKWTCGRLRHQPHEDVCPIMFVFKDETDAVEFKLRHA